MVEMASAQTSTSPAAAVNSSYPTKSQPPGVINLDKYRRSKSKASTDGSSLVEASSSSLGDSKHKSELASLSPEYRSLWNEVQIQGDYDSYARSTAKGKRRNSEASPTKNIGSTPSPRPAAKAEKPAEIARDDPMSKVQVSRQRRTRIKLSKPVIQLPVFVAKQSEAEVTTSPRIPEKLPENSVSEVKPNSINEQEKNRTKVFVDDESNMDPPAKACVDNSKEQGEVNENSLLNDSRLKVLDLDHHPMLEEKKVVEEKETSEEIQQSVTNKSRPAESEFSPPIASVMDFHNSFGARDYLYDRPTPQLARISVRDGKLEYYHEASSSQQHNEALSRQSAIFMANYLGMGVEPLPNMVTSIVVKPILPPLRGRNLRVLNRLRKTLWSNRHPTTNGDSPGPVDPPANSPGANNAVAEDHRGRASKELAPVRDVTRRHHSRVADDDVRRYRWEHGAARRRNVLWRKGEDSVFDQVVRWRSKIRHGANPAFRKVTSPTLGEMALRRKLTDRLPTREFRTGRPDPRELQPHEASENWRRAPSQVEEETGNATRGGGRGAAVRRVGEIQGGERRRRRQGARPLLETQSIMMDLPQPQMPARKRRPVWQRMR